MTDHRKLLQRERQGQQFLELKKEKCLFHRIPQRHKRGRCSKKLKAFLYLLLLAAFSFFLSVSSSDDALGYIKASSTTTFSYLFVALSCASLNPE